MPLAAGARLGPYEIIVALGAGGMGEVYRARDTRLGRDVAIKVLPEHLADSPERRQRLEREAKAVSSLNHPNICILYDIGHQDGVDFLVMEYLEGEALSARLTKGPLPVGQALQYSIQIAGALAAAQRQGISHRDLKPGNIMLTKAGAKLLDFGLAKLKTPGSQSGVWTSAMATVSGGITEAGTILGTLQYMAPEQLEGKAIDARADIFAFGAVLYEMLTGQKAFVGQSHASLIAAILEHDPRPISALQPLTPPSLDRIVQKCLAKDPDERWQSAQDLATELKWIAESPASATERAGEPARERARQAPLAWIAAAVCFVAALVVAVLYFFQPAPERQVMKLSLSPPEKTNFSSIVISPDGRRVAFTAAEADRNSRLWVRALDAVAAQPVAGTEGASNPFWSADSRWIAFSADGKLKKIDAAGGPAQVLADAGENRGGGAWSPQGVMVFSAGAVGALYQVPATGGEAKPATRLDDSQQDFTHRWPQFLPDGRRFIYYVFNRQGSSGIYAGSLDSLEKTRVVTCDASGLYEGTGAGGHLLFLRERTLMAQPFNPGKLQTTGEAVPVADQVGTDPFFRARFSVSPTGVLVYDSTVSTRGLRLLDRNGNPLFTVGPPGPYVGLDLSPDGGHVAAHLAAGDNDIWLFDLSRGGSSRFTFHPSLDANPVWSPDGQRIVFTSRRDGGTGALYQKLSSGAGEEELLWKSGAFPMPTGWSPDGRFLLFWLTSLLGPMR